VGEQQVAVGSLARDRHQPPVPKPRRTASTWSTARPPSSHAVSASAQSERPRSRTDRRPRGSNVVTFDRTQITREPYCESRPNAGAHPYGSVAGSHRMGRRRTRRTPRSSRPSASVPPLPREPLRQTHPPSSRGRGGGGGTTSCRATRRHRHSHPAKRNSGASSANMSRKPGERVASATWWKRSQHNRGSNAPRVSNHGEAKSAKYAAKCGVRKPIALGTRSPAS
jgi:hypothetical protein